MTDNKNQPVVISGRGIKKTYGHGEGAFQALKGVSLDVYKGESVAIVGKSGSGKSTLMHLLALLDTPDQGTLEVLGNSADRMKAKDLNKLRNETFGFVFQQFFLNSSATVLDNVLLPLKIAGVPSKERKRRAMEVLEQMELADKAKNRATDLSGGQKQRAVIARALVGDPTIIFADEFTGNLDSETGAKIEKVVFDLNKERGITLVIVTHDNELAAKCDRQIRIKDGLILAEGVEA